MFNQYFDAGDMRGMMLVRFEAQGYYGLAQGDR